MGVAEQETDEIPTTMVWNHRFSVINDSFTKRKPVKTVDLDFYTDGAFFGRNAGPTGPPTTLLLMFLLQKKE